VGGGAIRTGLGEADGMASAMPVVVYPPDEDGGRRVRVDGEILGRAYDLRDIGEFLRRAGIEDADETYVAQSALIEWRGGGPNTWTP
jgi:hypothetical protein